MNLNKLVQTTPSVLVDEIDLARFGHLSAWIDDLGRIKISLGSREEGKAFLHRLILDTFSAVDHINGNPADNRRGNLREATLSQNQGNRKTSLFSKSGYKGVSWHKASKKFRARLGTKTGEIYLGLFDSPEAAALAYNEAAVKYFGEFAKLNKVIT